MPTDPAAIHRRDKVAPGVGIPFGVYREVVLDRPYGNSGKTVYAWTVESFRKLEAMPSGSPEANAFGCSGPFMCDRRHVQARGSYGDAQTSEIAFTMLSKPTTLKTLRFATGCERRWRRSSVPISAAASVSARALIGVQRTLDIPTIFSGGHKPKVRMPANEEVYEIRPTEALGARNLRSM